MDRPYGPVHSRGAEVAKHPTGVYLQGSWVQGEQASPFFFYRKKKGAKPLRAKSCPFGAVALRDAAAAAEMLTPYKEFRSLRGATRAPPWTCRPLKRAALNFRPYESVCRVIAAAWRLGLTGAAPIQSVKGRGIASPCAR